ncbi:MAG: Fe2+-dependent dioxygenase [Steroidobacteraceae bacterium]
MFLHIPNFLNTSDLESLRAIARQAKFVDGRLTNPHNTVKNNTIADANDPFAQQASQIALAALQRSEQARNFVFPQRVALPTLCRYEAGMTYGPHVDTAFLPAGPQPMRCDVSCTMFVSDPATYEGGELAIYIGGEAVRIKGPAGHAVFYASTQIHQVAPVTAGERLVVITFIESQIADSLKRDLLYALNEVRALEGLKMDWRNRTQLEYVLSNLQRMWAS